LPLPHQQGWFRDGGVTALGTSDESASINHEDFGAVKKSSFWL